MNYPAGKTPVIAVKAVAVVPSDATPLAKITSALYIGVGGDLKVTLANDTTPLIMKVVAGRLDIAAKQVFATGTTATNITALY